MTITGISESIEIDAPKSVVWSVLADFPNIADWTDSVKTSEQATDHAHGMHAERTCDLAPMGNIRERIVEWEPETKMVIDIYETAKIPIKRSLTTFTVESLGDDRTKATMSPEAMPGGGIFSGLIGKRLAKGLPKAARGLLSDLKVEAEARHHATATS